MAGHVTGLHKENKFTTHVQLAGIPQCPLSTRANKTHSLTSCAAKLLRTSTTPCEDDVKRELNAEGRRRKSDGYTSPAVPSRPNSLMPLIADNPVHDVMAHRPWIPLVYLGKNIMKVCPSGPQWTSIHPPSSPSFLSAHPVVSFPHFSFLLP